MNVIDWMKERELNNKLINSEEALDEAIKIYDSSKQALKNIRDTEGMKLLMNYWMSRKEACESFFLSDATSPDLMLKTRGRYEEATKFLQFLDNMTTEIR